MTTVRSEIKSDLGKKIQAYRTDRPNEWTMDEFTREAEVMNEKNKALKALLKEVQAIIELSPAVTDTIWYNDQNTLYDEIYLRINGDDKCEQLNLLEHS